MTVFRTFSKLQIEKIFAVNRTTIYDWERHGVPFRQQGRPGRSAKFVFETVTEWYLFQEEIKGVSEEGLDILEEGIRGRKDKYYG